MARWYCVIICVYAYVSFHYTVIVPLLHLVSEFLMFFCLLWSMNYLICDRCDSNKISFFFKWGFILISFLWKLHGNYQFVSNVITFMFVIQFG